MTHTPPVHRSAPAVTAARRWSLDACGEHCFLFLLVLTTRLSDLFSHFQDWDEAAMMAQGWAMTQGQVLYRDIFQIHPVLNIALFCPFFYALDPDVAPHAIKTLNALLVFAGALLIRRIARDWIRAKEAGLIAAALFAYYLGNSWALSSFGEFYTLFPVLLSAYLLFCREGGTSARFVMVGLLWGIAFFIKQVAAFDAAALCLGFLLKDKRPMKEKVHTGGCIGLGILAVFLAISIYFLSENSFAVAMRSMLIEPLLHYAAPPSGRDSWGALWTEILRPMLWHFSGALLSAAAAAAWLLTGKPNGSTSPGGLSVSTSPAIALLWLFGSLCGALWSGKEHLHYILPLVSPVSLLAVFILRAMTNRARAILGWAVAGAALVAGGHRSLPQLRTLAASHWMEPRVQGSLAIAKHIRNSTGPQDRIFLYGVSNLDVFYLSGRLSNNGIYMYIDMDGAHMNDPELEARKQREFLQNLPAVMVVNTSREFHENTTRSAEAFFSGVLRERYVLTGALGQAGFYFRTDRAARRRRATRAP